MNIRVPIYVEERKPEAGVIQHVRPVRLRPLFFPHPTEQDVSLQRGTARLANSLRADLGKLARLPRHEHLALYSFYPQMEETMLEFTIEVAKKRFSLRHLFVIVPAFGRRFAWSPSVPDVWVEVSRGETLRDRVQETLTEHYRLQERRFGTEAVQPDRNTVHGKAWITSIDVAVDVPTVYTPPVQNIFAAIGEMQQVDGATELTRVGRSLNSLYPDDLDHAIDREAEITELSTLLSASDRRPVLVIGKRLVGKTAIIHEFVRRRMDRRRSSEVTLHIANIADLQGDVWLVSPQRLISGMSYLGQWEGRFLAILKESQRKHHTLYFDDLIGLFYSGRTSSSQLSVAHVLKPYLERGDVRVLAECTPEAFRVLQELDRSFADLFQIVRIEEPNEQKNLHTLLGSRRTLEQQHDTRFHADVLPVVIDLTRRYVSDAAFPGKAARLLQSLASKHKAGEVTRADALAEFSARSGLSVSFLDDRSELDYARVVDALSVEVIGQKAAVTACADAVTIAKARLNDSIRPIASFLFLGPTGVGKTQCAKALANYLFGDRERLIRFDMNEFASYYSVARLTGTLDAPEGLLTSAVRRSPFAVLLFDEIEKAHPAVFDLLLGVMGDGRLTDARGQLVDFSNTIIILTSNLGAREAASDLGFRQTNRSDASVYRLAAERFFKPEFFNRLSRVVPFERLSREDVQGIANRLIEDVFNREGLVRRGVKLVVETGALNLLVEAGYHPQLGARALKRTLERQVTAPIAARLAATPADQPLIIFLKENAGKIAVDVCALQVVDTGAPGKTVVPVSDAAEFLDRVEDVVIRVEELADRLFPPGEILLGGESAMVQMQQVYVRQQTRRVSRMLERADERRAKQAGVVARSGVAPPKRTNVKGYKRQLAKALTGNFDNRIFAQNLHQLISDLSVNSEVFGDKIDDYFVDLLNETSLLHVLSTIVDGSNVDVCPQTVIRVVSLDGTGRAACLQLRDLYRTLFEREFNCKVINSDQITSPHMHVAALSLEGPLAALLAPLEAGTHLFVSKSQTYQPVVVTVGPAAAAERIQSLPPVLRIYADPDATLDLRTQLLSIGKIGSAEMRAFMLAALPLPNEFN
ncbi:MAG TPA: AAA family ATPase [Pyrinomonadaceae bacterium]|nr:AAA family ATPase [Pyrinomonadaceae bacterium]